MKSVLLLLITLTVISGNLKSQDSKTEMAVYNIGLGSIVSGIGALINKEPDEQWGKVLLKGMGQGAIGGYFVYESKNLMGQLSKEKKWEYSWYAKFMNSAGISIIENASSNRDFWEQWHLNIGFSRFEIYTKDNFRFRYKIMPVSLFLTVSVALNSKFELKRSLQTGEFVFSTPNTSGSNRGRTFGNVVVIKNDFMDEYDLYAHEFLHIYQYYDFNFVNNYLNRKYSKRSKASSSFSKKESIFKLDLNGLVLWPVYFIQEGLGVNNFYEKEADFWEH